jgi:DNA repair protein RecN (Recombination protein N)
MLRHLQIESYGLIERAEVEFADGATIFTGETGSGKTMLLGALDFALGGRAGPDVVRRGARRALVTLSFDVDDRLRTRLAADGFDLDAGEAGSIAREMSESGRSSLRVNGRPSTAGYVRDLRDAIAEIVGQHEAHRLLAPSYHLELLDRFAGAAALRARESVAAAYERAESAAQALAELTEDALRARERYDDACFTAREIDEARLESSEVERLTERRIFLDNVERIVLALHSAREALAADDGGATGAIGAAGVALAGVAKFDGRLSEMAARAATLQAEVVDLAGDVARVADAAEYDPAELEAINLRLDLIDRLKRKYGGSVEELGAVAQQAHRTIDEYENRDRLVADFTAAAEAAKHEVARAASALTALRKKAAAALSKQVLAEFAEIALAAGRFEVAFEPLERIGPHGAERVEFLFAANAGEPARPLTRVASGGELSRVLLALVVVLAAVRDARTALVFDEIDAGVGGTTATAVGARIGALARRGQVVCVTHLAQLATWADRHYVLDKLEQKRASSSETTIAVREIGTVKEREAEIARMLSGEPQAIAVRHARALLAAAKR